MVAAAIMAGGRGSRLGEVDKSALVLDGRTIIERQLAVLRPLFDHILLVAAAPPAHPPWRRTHPIAGVTVLHDRPPAGRGPLAGIQAALGALAGDETAVVCVGSDMPLLQAPALTLLRDHAPEASALVPLVGGHPEPLFARYGRDCLGPLTAALAAGALQAGAFARTVPGRLWLTEPQLRAADPGLRSLENINTPADLHRVQALLGQP